MSKSEFHIAPQTLRGYSFLGTPVAILLGVFFAIDPASQLANDFRSVSVEPPHQLSQTAWFSDYTSPYSPLISPEAGSEAFWLSRSLKKNEFASVAWNAPVSVGDLIMVDSGAYKQRMLKVVSVQQIPKTEPDLNATTKIVTELSYESYYILTCQDPLQNIYSPIEILIVSTGNGLQSLGSSHRAL